MKTRTLLLAAFCLTAVIASFAATDANVGTWKLNEAKSKMPAGVAKNTTVVYTAAGDSYKCVVDGVDAAGRPAHNEWTGKFDGKDYAVNGDPASDMRSIQKVDARHYKIWSKKDGKTTLSGTIDYSADGKTRTLTTHGNDASGKKMTAISVYDKQ
jgi:hypothetical protein